MTILRVICGESNCKCKITSGLGSSWHYGNISWRGHLIQVFFYDILLSWDSFEWMKENNELLITTDLRQRHAVELPNSNMV
jgi:hypothetical protein